MTTSLIIQDNSVAELNRVMKLVQAQLDHLSGKQTSTPSNIASGTSGLNANANAALAAATGALTGLNQINSVNYLTNLDQINILAEYQQVLAAQAQLDPLAAAIFNAGSTIQANFDNAISAFSANLILAGAASNWQTTWPSGATITLNTGYTTSSIATWWSTITTAENALQNSINQASYTLALGTNWIPNPIGAWGPVPNPPQGYSAPTAWISQGFNSITNIGAGNSYTGGSYARVYTAAGNYSTNPAGPQTPIYNGFYQGVPLVKQGQAVTGMAHVKMPSGTGTAWISIQFLDPTGTTQVGSIVSGPTVSLNSSWQIIELASAIVPSGAGQAEMFINISGNSSLPVWADSLFFYLDNIPATTAAAGVVKVNTTGTGLAVATDGTVSTTFASTTPGSTGAALVGFLSPLTGAQGTTLQQREQLTVPVTDFMSAAQITAWTAAQATYDMTSTIQTAITGLNSRGGGTLILPFVGTGVYNLVANSSVAPWQSIFMLSSNTHIVFERGVQMTVNGSTNANCGVWGVQTQANAATVVSNISFKDVWIVSNSSSPNPLSAFQLNGPPSVTTTAGNISDVHFEKCRGDNCTVFFIVENLASGGAAGRLYTRTTQNVTIDRCRGNNCYTFANADGADILINKCIATGSTTAGDAVTVRCGVHVTIEGCDFSIYQNGNCIDISDDSNNSLGPLDVKVRGGSLHDNGSSATVVKIAGNQGTNYGVNDISLVGVNIYNGGTSINVTNTGGTASQITNVTLNGNQIDGCQVGIQSINGSSKQPYNFTLTGNVVNMPSAATYPALALTNLQLGTITGNHLYSANSGSTYNLTSIQGCSYYTESGNTYFCSATTTYCNLRGTTTQNGQSSCIGNTFYNTVQFSLNYASPSDRVAANNFLGSVTVNGNTLPSTRYIEWDHGNIIFGATTSPTTGTWQTGDKAISLTPTSSSTPAWTCTTGGSPGTWTAWPVL